jgi:hypothetical protein
MTEQEIREALEGLVRVYVADTGAVESDPCGDFVLWDDVQVIINRMTVPVEEVKGPRLEIRLVPVRKQVLDEVRVKLRELPRWDSETIEGSDVDALMERLANEKAEG